MTNATKRRGAAAPRAIGLVCDESDRLLRVLHDPARIAVDPGQPVSLLFEPGSRDKALRLLEELRAGRPAYGWELHVRAGERSLPMRFVGTSVPDGVMLAGAEIQSHANALLGLMVQQAGLEELPQRAIPRADEDPYERLTELANQLAAMQRDLEKRNAELTHLLEDRARIAAMAAHDLRAPLQVISTGVEILARRLGAEGAPFRPLLEVVQRSLHQMMSLVDDLLTAYSEDIAKLELFARPLDLRALVERSAESNRALAEQKGLGLRFAASESAVVVLGDALRLDQVLNNLVHSSINYSPPGSTIHLNVRAEGGEALVTVEDDGPGMDPNVLDELVGRQPGGAPPGTSSPSGFGLTFAINRALVAKHYGKLDGEAVPGGGVRFTIRIPVQRGAPSGASLPA